MSIVGASMEAIGQRFIEAFNRRDADALVALADPRIEWHPSSLVGARRTYLGHDGLRRWVAELEEYGAAHQVRVREVRALDASSFLILSEVLVDDVVSSPSAMVAHLTPEGMILEGRAYLTDEELLTQVGVVPAQPTADIGDLSNAARLTDGLHLAAGRGTA
jgi:SnoaL-like domain